MSIGRDRSFVCLDLIAFIDCGRNAKVVREAAINPMINVESKSYKFDFIYSAILSLPILSCLIVSLSLIVTVLSLSVPESTVIQ